MKNHPKVSIVTVCFNCKDVIEKTICNVLKQTYRNIEYIVIDGASTDGTKEMVEHYADQLAYWKSESDSGIYDAMNKGINVATGDWIIFRNAGDYFFKPTTIEDVFNWYEDKGEDFIVGGTRSFGSGGYHDKFYCLQDADVWHRAFISHPSTFVRLSVQKNNLFPTSYRIASDYFFFQKLMLDGAAMVCYDGIVSLFDSESGISSTHLVQSWKEILLIRRQLNAPRNVLKETQKVYFKTRMYQILANVLKVYKPLFRIYCKKHQHIGWTQQSLSITLKDI